MKCSLCVLLLTIGTHTRTRARTHQNDRKIDCTAFNVSVKFIIFVLRRTCKKHITVYPSITVSDVHDTSVKYSGFILPCVCDRQTDRRGEREREHVCVRMHRCLCVYVSVLLLMIGNMHSRLPKVLSDMRIR